MRIIFPAKRDLAIGEVDDPVVGDGDAMRIAGQIVQNMLWPSERPLGIDDPVLAKQRAKEGSERPVLEPEVSSAWEESSPLRKARLRPATNLPRNTRLRTLTGRKKR